MENNSNKLYKKLIEKLSDTNIFIFTGDLENSISNENNNINITISPLLEELEKENINNSIPLFCPHCGKIMNTEIDKRSFQRFGMCHVCWSKFETKLRINGKYDNYMYELNKRNIETYLNELEKEIKQYLSSLNKNKGLVTSSTGNIIYLQKTDSKTIKQIEKELWDKYENLKKELYKKLENGDFNIY